MKLGVVILHWKDEDRTLSLIQKILDWHIVNPIILLVQNETSSDKFPDLVHQNIKKSYALENLGYGGGNNIGIQASLELGLDYTLLLNTDAHIEESEVKKLLEHIQQKNTIFSIGPALTEFTDSTKHQYIGGRNIAENISTRIKLNEQSTTDKISLNVDYVIGAIILLRNKYIDTIGLFDRDYFFSGEVADLCYRAKQLGYKNTTLLAAKGTHHTEKNPLRNNLYKYYSLRNRFLFIRKYKLDNKHLYFWYKLIIKETIHSIITFDKEKLMTMTLTLFDVLKRKKGNRNKLFIK